MPLDQREGRAPADLFGWNERKRSTRMLSTELSDWHPIFLLAHPEVVESGSKNLGRQRGAKSLARCAFIRKFTQSVT